MPYSNIMLNLYSTQEDILNKYIDNRVLLVKILIDYFRFSDVKLRSFQTIKNNKNKFTEKELFARYIIALEL
jgi:hypothetical protein